MSPSQKIVFVSLWLDDHTFGCGRRHFMVMHGRKWCRLIELATGQHRQIPIADFHAGHPLELFGRASKPAAIARRLRTNARTFGNDKTAPVKAALKLLRGMRT